jgi:putative ABC transport system permease protein
MDLIKNKSKSLLIILTLFIGMISVGVVVMINTVFVPDVYREYQSALPKDAAIKTGSGFSNDLLTEIRSIDGVKAAAGTNRITVRLLLDSGTLNADLIALDGTNSVNRLKKGDNTDTLPELQANEIFIDRAAMKDIGKEPGDTITLLFNGQEVELVIKDTVYDATAEPYMLEGDVISFANQETFERLTGEGQFRDVNILVNGDNSDKNRNLDVARKVAALMEAKGVEIDEIEVPEPGAFYASEILDSVTIILVLLGGMSVLLGMALIVNNVSNIMLQQTKYIGIMKAIGGRTHHMIIMYTGFILALGMIAFLLSLPLSALVGYQVSQFLAYMFNISLAGFRIPLELVTALLISALGIPLLASIVPIVKGSGKSIYHALSKPPVYAAIRSGSLTERIIGRLPHIPSLILISLRNNLRSRLRVILTIATLALSGSIILTVMNLNDSFARGIEEVQAYYVIDGTVILNSFEDANQIETLLADTQGVKSVEGWSFTVARFMEDNNLSSRKMKLMGPKPDSEIFNWAVASERITDGRQIRENDTNAVVITNHLLSTYPDLSVGDTIKIKVRDKICDFSVVGIMNMAGQPADPVLLVNYKYLNSLLNGEDRVQEICVSTVEQNEAYQQKVFTDIEQKLNQKDITVFETLPGADLLEKFQTPITVLVSLLMFLAAMLSVVGAVGQSGTLNLSVIERAKEFGIMRSVGVSNRKLNAMIVLEGMLLGAVAWILAVIISFPLSMIANEMLGVLLFSCPLGFSFSIPGMFLWLLVAILSSCAASILPCRKLNRMITRDVLAYE